MSSNTTATTNSNIIQNNNTNNKSLDKLPPPLLCDDQIEIKPKEQPLVKNLNDPLKNSTALELKMQDEIHALKKQLNQKENEHKKDKAVLDQNIELLKLQIQEYKKREENLKKMNETIMNSLNDIANQGNSSKIFKEIQQNYEQHNKELVESKAKHQITINNLENENRVLKDSINEMKLQIKDLEIALEKEKINNERAYEVNILDKTQMENDLQKQHLMNEEGFYQTKFALESKVQEITYQKDQQLLEQREKYEVQIRTMQTNFEKEKHGLEQRIQKNLNTIRKYQTHIEQNVSMNSSSINIGNQSKMDISCLKTETDIELRAEIIKIQNEKSKINLDLQHQIQQTYQKDDQILKQSQKITELNKQIEELKQKLSIYEQNGNSSSRTFASSSNLKIREGGQNTPQINRSSSQMTRNQRSQSNLQQQGQNTTNNMNMPLQQQQLLQQNTTRGLRDSLKLSQVQQRISNVNYTQPDEKSMKIYSSQVYQFSDNKSKQQQFMQQQYNEQEDQQLQDDIDDLSGQQQQQQSQIIPNNIYMQLQQQFQMSQDGNNILQDTQNQSVMYNNNNNNNNLQQSTNNLFNQSHNNYVAPFQNTLDNLNQIQEPLADATQLFNQFGNQQFISPNNNNNNIDDDQQQPFTTPNQDKYTHYNNNNLQENLNYSQQFQKGYHPNMNKDQVNDQSQIENRKRGKKSLHDQENRSYSPLVNQSGKQQQSQQQQYKNSAQRTSQILRNLNASPVLINEYENQQNDRNIYNMHNQSQSISYNNNNPNNMSNNNINALNNNYKTLLLCENCGQCFVPNDLVDHMASCNPQLQQQLNDQQFNMTQQHLNLGVDQQQQQQQYQLQQQSMHLDRTQLLQQQQDQSNEQNEEFYKVIDQLNYEKQLVEQKLYILENHLKNSENTNGIVAQDRDRLKSELDHIMLELGKTKMNQVVQSEEQVACTVALKNEIKFLINKLLKAKGKLSENNINTTLNQTQNMENISYFNDMQQSQYGLQFNPNQSQINNNNRKDYSQFSIKGCVDFNNYSNNNNINNSQCLIDSTCLRDSNFIHPHNNINKSIHIDQNQFYPQNNNSNKSMNQQQQNQIFNNQKKMSQMNSRSINNMSNISQNSYF